MQCTAKPELILNGRSGSCGDGLGLPEDLVWVPALTWQMTTNWDSRSGVSDALLWPLQALYSNSAHIHAGKQPNISSNWMLFLEIIKKKQAQVTPLRRCSRFTRPVVMCTDTIDTLVWRRCEEFTPMRSFFKIHNCLTLEEKIRETK